MKQSVLYTVLLCVCLSYEQPARDVPCPEGCRCPSQDQGIVTGCINMHFTEIPKEISNNTLQLYLQGNTIREVGPDAFINQPLLRTLVFSDSGIQNLHSNAFNGLEDLTSLDLRHNKIRVLKQYTFSSLKKLERIILDGNRIRIIESFAFAGAGRLYDGISMSLKKNNRLQEIQPRAFEGANIEELLINNSSLSNSSLDSLRDLKSSLKLLFLQNNRVPLYFPPNVFSGFKLMLLSLPNNGIRDADFLRHVTATDISLANNPIGTVNFSQYKSLANVRNLQLVNTGMTKIHSDYFKGMVRLSQLELSRNYITTLPENTKSLFSRLQEVSLRENSIHCNCEILWFKDWLRNSHNRVIGAECQTPFQTEIRNADDSMFTCKGPTTVTISKEIQKGKATLVCISNGDPPSNLTWLTPMGDSFVYEPQNKYTKNIARLDIEDGDKNGVYTCNAENLKGDKQAVINLDVYKTIAMARSQKNGSSCNKTSLISLFMVIVSFTLYCAPAILT